ncbi:hypothetical protein C8J56DRAFT_1157692 [Mycena floridula]|nr:hypothetical protein C8J56DRAFT_1157692 [Mycena floridula]
MPTLDVFPAIPAEITLAFLQKLVEMEPSKAVELMSLSRGLRPFVERLLYRYITLVSKKQVSLFVALIRSGIRPISFYQDRIRGVCVASQEHTLDDMITIISVCRDVHTFASTTVIWSYRRTVQENRMTAYHSALSTLQPIRVYIAVRQLSQTSIPGFDWLSKVTHLELHIEQDPKLEFNDTVLQHLPQLTHLSYLGSETAPSFVSCFASSLRLSPKMVVCIVWTSDRSSWMFDIVPDPRVVLGYNMMSAHLPWPSWLKLPKYMLQRNPFDPSRFLNDWGWNSTSREPDMWELAEEKVEIQRRLRLS